MQLMNSSLNALVKNLSNNCFRYLSQEFKGAYPNEYIESFKRIFDDKLSDRREFYIFLKDEWVCEKDYKHAVNIWNMFKLKTMGDYHDRCLKTDILLLGNVLEKIICVCLKYYGLDSCHYFSSPGLSWNAMLKMTVMKLELNLDIDIYLFIEKDMKGGIFYIAKRYSKANNKYMKSHDGSRPNK